MTHTPTPREEPVKGLGSPKAVARSIRDLQCGRRGSMRVHAWRPWYRIVRQNTRPPQLLRAFAQETVICGYCGAETTINPYWLLPKNALRSHWRAACERVPWWRRMVLR